MLVGRERECHLLDLLLGQVAAGSSATMLMVGEAGIGKTCLIDYALGRAEGFAILRAAGIESEQDLPFAGLADLLRPIVGYLDRLTDIQGEVLRSALALGPPVAANRFATCAATLSLLAEAASHGPVLVVVDDGHWLDRATAQVLEFTARRLGDDAVGLIVAQRPGIPGGLDIDANTLVAVDGVELGAAAELLASSGRQVSPSVVVGLAEGVAGNPLALLDLAATLTCEQLDGRASLPEPLPMGATLRAAFARRLEALDPEARRLLLLAAADAAVDLTALQGAACRMSVDTPDLGAAEAAGLIRVDAGRIAFHHPLVRAAAYHDASAPERRAAHLALAETVAAETDPIRRALHLAAAATGPDDGVAASLEQAGGVAVARNAFAAGAHAYQRAAELTTDTEGAAHCWTLAGAAALLAGDPNTASRLFDCAVETTGDALTRADAQAMRAHSDLWLLPPLALHRRLIAEAETVETLDRSRAATLFALAVFPCLTSARIDSGYQAAVRAATLARTDGGLPRLLADTMLANMLILTGRRSGAAPILDGLSEALATVNAHPAVPVIQMLSAQALMWCEQYPAADAVLQASIGIGRSLGRLPDLPYGLAVSSEMSFRTGRWADGYAESTEAVELAEIGSGRDLTYALVCLARFEAATGRSRACRDHVARAVALAQHDGVDSILSYASATLGFLEVGATHYPKAVLHLTQTAQLEADHGVDDPNVIQWRPDLIEALARLGRTNEAGEHLDAFEEQAERTSSSWALAVAARARGLIASGDAAVAQLEYATALADGQPSRFEQARTQLCLGEAYRRTDRPDDATRCLEQAAARFNTLGARPWSRLAAVQLVATTGRETTTPRPPVHELLSARELRVALRVAEGETNREVAAALFFSPKTVEVHLTRIYRKLGVRSRTELARLFAHERPPDIAADR